MAERLYSLKAEFFKALAHPTRVRILEQLRQGEKCVCKFIEDLELEQPNISQHLAVLRKEDIVVTRKEGLKVLYRVKHPEIFQVLDLVGRILTREITNTMAELQELQGKEEKKGS
ncbi:putative HTH-type transcriptional regulator [Neomoorella glycerini]|uniref:Putative HTH-type transcriptional regulator n=1 Tax=Neomoorella glycerini TaxID=55779 RepID=A0A6I5ZPJ0_9FIRM|nr:metalloregulator ArsR/SmtB family transcription factor [Moorella glycerini]QGP91451.1 putative HTH-type transcriptional regulator [Moorella glycerini]